MPSIPIKLEPLGCKPVLHGSFQKCIELTITISVQKLLIQNWFGPSAVLSFYITDGNGLTLLRTRIIRTSEQL